MDAFEIIRKSASDLNAEIVRKGVDPFDVPALVSAVASKRELDIVLLATGDPALKGARALHDGKSGVILVEDRGTEIERAMLVAHEIGHDVHHGGSQECTGSDIDLSSSTELAPVGLQRVEDYGVRERRELQANVFARELLFPRAFARSLHIDQGLAAKDISAKSGLPASLVRQQILDAVLLPVLQPEIKPASQPVKPDPAQDRAAVHRRSPYQLQAGPGTGKTRTLVKRIISLTDEVIDPASILALTFSNRAAGELAERVATVLPEHAPKIWIGTFHSFGLDILRRHGEKIGLPASPSLFDRSDAISVLEEILPTLDLRHNRNLWDPTLILRDVLSGISRAKDELKSDQEYRELAEAMRAAAKDEKQIVAADRCLEVALIYEKYEEAKRARGAVDFGDLIMLPAKILHDDDAVAAAVRLRHRYVLVDEYQDVNRASIRLLQGLAADGKRLWVVGDARQSIYRFRGASSGNMAAFDSDFPGAKIEALERSYRSTGNIIRAFSGFSSTMSASTGMIPLRLDTDSGAGSEVEVSALPTPDAELEGVAASIVELRNQGIRLRDQAVLCRTNARLNDVAVALEERGIPALHLGSLFERHEIRDLLALLSLAVDRKAAGLVRVACHPRYNVEIQDVYAAIRILGEKNVQPLHGLKQLSSHADISEQGRAGFALLVKDLSGLETGQMPWDFLTSYLLDRTDLVRQMSFRTSISDWMCSVAVWQFLNFLRDEGPAGAGFPIWRTLERIRQLVLLAEERDLRQVPASALQMDAVRLMTVHGSKGLEFEAVHLPGMTETNIPSSYRGQRCAPPDGMIADATGLSSDEFARTSHSAEEECLYFVAMSRARTHLKLYRSETQPNGKGRTKSGYLSRTPGLSPVAAPPTMPLPGGPRKPSTISVITPSEFGVTDNAIGIYRKCPRRYFYTYIFGLSGAKKPTLFTQTHGCLYELINWLQIRQLSGNPSIAEAEAKFDEFWSSTTVSEHPAAPEYRQLASRIVGAMIAAGSDRKFKQAEAIAIDLQHGRLIVEPNAIAEMPDGTIVLRRLRTGYKRSDEYESTDHMEYGLYIHAARIKYGHSAQVEAVHLTDNVVETVQLTARVVENRIQDAARMLGLIRSGLFPADPEPIACARCPHFFVCAAAPVGTLNMNSKNI